MTPPLIILICTLYAALQAVFSEKNQSEGGWYLLLIWSLTMFSPWPWISRFSRNLMFDGLLADVTIAIVFYLVLCLVAGRGLVWGQYLAGGVAVAALVVFKVLERPVG